ncbi:MAG: hypothetical protein JWM19_1722 [Actinomycetia bacterium]|nr:hypothetical protein [Actinomycetes bacterium]
MAGKTRTMMAALALLAGLTGVTACASQGGGPASLTGTAAAAGTTEAASGLEPGACPSRVPGSQAGAPSPAAPPGSQQLIPTDAVTAVICQYALHPSFKTAGLVPRFVLSGAAAQGLAVVLDATGVVVGKPPRCAPGQFAQLIMFGYRTGPAVAASVELGCTATSALVTVGSRSGVTGQMLDADLFAFTEAGPPSSGPATPDLIGLSGAAAARAAARHGFTVAIDGAVLDDAVPLGTVIFQSLPPGAFDAGPPGAQVGVILAVPQVPACTAAQLALSYRDGGFGAGSDFGGITIRDVSAAPCQLAGEVSVTGLNASGNPVTSTVTAEFAAPGVLSPHGPPVPAHGTPVPGDLEYWVQLGSEYRDGNTPSGLCPRQLIPAAWRVTLASGAAFAVPDSDPGDAGPNDPAGSLITCQGNLMSVGAPSYWTS